MSWGQGWVRVRGRVRAARGLLGSARGDVEAEEVVLVPEGVADLVRDRVRGTGTGWGTG